MKVYLIRHGQIPSNALRQYPAMDEQLTATGIEQATALRERINNMKFDAVFCSPLERAKQTARIITDNRSDIFYDDRLRERGYGDYTGKPLEAMDREEWWNYHAAVRFGTSENIVPFFERVFDFLEELKTKEFNTVLVVTHAGVSKAFSAYFEGMGDGGFLNRKFQNCEIKEYELL